MSGRILITGFGPFPGVDDNPTTRVVEALQREDWPGFDLHVVDVTFDAARTAPAELSRDAMIPRLHLGVASSARRLRVERVGRNRVAPHRVDASGGRCGRGLCDPSRGEEHARATGYDVAALADHLESAGLTTEISDDAGGYVCNAIYYASLALGPDSLFLHVPPIGAPRCESPGADWTLDDLVSAARATARWMIGTAPTARPTIGKPTA